MLASPRNQVHRRTGFGRKAPGKHSRPTAEPATSGRERQRRRWSNRPLTRWFRRAAQPFRTARPAAGWSRQRRGWRSLSPWRCRRWRARWRRRRSESPRGRQPALDGGRSERAAGGVPRGTMLIADSSGPTVLPSPRSRCLTGARQTPPVRQKHGRETPANPRRAPGSTAVDRALRLDDIQERVLPSGGHGQERDDGRWHVGIGARALQNATGSGNR